MSLRCLNWGMDAKSARKNAKLKAGIVFCMTVVIAICLGISHSKVIGPVIFVLVGALLSFGLYRTLVARIRPTEHED